MSLPRMSLHIGDYKKDTGHLGAAEHGAYLMLTMHYWATGGLPSDDVQLARIACMTDKAWKVARPVLAAFFQSGWKHKRIDRELSDAQAKYERRALAGKQGGNAKAAAKQCPSNATPPPPAIAKQPITLTQEKEEDGGGDAGARGLSLISDEAGSIASEIAVFCGLSEDPTIRPPAWYGAPMTVQSWLNEGCKREIIIPACREAVARKRDGAPDTINYFTKAVARAHAQFKAPMPVVTLFEPEQIHAINRSTSGQNTRAGSVVAAALAQRDTFADRARLAVGADRDPVLSLPKG